MWTTTTDDAVPTAHAALGDAVSALLEHHAALAAN
jgi:hypothetical protein